MMKNALVWAYVLTTFGTASAGPYEDCILQNMKGVQAQAAAGAIMRACKEKTTPKKCRGAELRSRFEGVGKENGPRERFGNKPGAFDDLLSTECLKECADASYWSRTFGDCRTD